MCVVVLQRRQVTPLCRVPFYPPAARGMGTRERIFPKYIDIERTSRKSKRGEPGAERGRVVKADGHMSGDDMLRRHDDGSRASFDGAVRPTDNHDRPSPAADPSQADLVMPTQLPPCPKCQDNLFVRLEQVLSGRRVSRAYYCGRCIHEWTIETIEPAAAVPERRSAERRRRPRPA